MYRSAFSLIELLLTMAIIAILVSMLLPAIDAIRSAAQRVSCATRLRGLASATLAYAQDSHGQLPRNGVRAETLSRSDNFNWVNFEMFPLQRGNMQPNAVASFMGNGAMDAKALCCPGVRKISAQRTTWGWGFGAAGLQMGGLRTDYTYWNQADNFAGDGQGPAPYTIAPWARRRLGEVCQDTSASLIFVNNGRWPVWVHQRDDDFGSGPLFSDFAMRSPWYDDYSHGRSLANSYVNTVHVDGHLASRKIEINDPYLTIQATNWGGLMIYNYR